jgi:hypothetical protein
MAAGDAVYAEGPPRVIAAPSQLANTGQVQLIAWRYASLLVRYPSAIGAVSGTGLVILGVL